MDIQPISYGKLCSLFYDASKKFAPEKEVAFFASFIKGKEARVLEAMCGSGRLLIPLMQSGYSIDGVDNSAIMLGRCRERAAAFDLKPVLFEQSLERLSLPHMYSVVTIAVGSFQLIVDRAVALKALKSLRAHMHEGADLLIDIFTPDTSANSISQRIARLDDHTVVRLSTRYLFYESEKRADAFCFYELVVDGIVQQREDELIQITWYSDDELERLLTDAGFELVKIYDESFRSSGPSRIAHARAIDFQIYE